MDLDANKLLENALKEGIREAVKAKFAQSYNNPLDALMTKAINDHAEATRRLLADAMQACLSDDDFRRQVAGEVRGKLAKLLVHRFGGELEKQINTLKSDPATRARITLAIEEIVKDRSPAAA